MRDAKTTTRATGRGRRIAVAAFVLGAVALGGILALSAAAGGRPDVTVIYLGSTRNYGADNGLQGYAVGTTSCNVGETPLWWCNDAGDTFCDTDQHPVIAQNMYRVDNGRFEQIGMGWLKHGFFSTNSFDPACGSCTQPPHGGDQLGVGCIDTYGASLNGSRPLGMRSEVNPTTGAFPYPYTDQPTGTVVDQRIIVKQSELDPSGNPTARYFVEGHYIAADDHAAGGAFNNASYREVTVDPTDYDLTFVGGTVREDPAIVGWKAIEPKVALAPVDTPDNAERFWVGRNVVRTMNAWRYEYAVFNMNSDRSANEFTVTFPGGATISNPGFRDVDHHSGEPYATTDWVVDTATPGQISWSTDDFATDQNANALRWSTAFSFWFEADIPPPLDLQHTLTLFKPGIPSNLGFEVVNDVFDNGFEGGTTAGWDRAVP